MPLRLSRIATVLVLASVAAGAAQAQTHRLHIGPRVSYQFDYEKLGLGGQFSVPVMKQLEFYPSFDYFFVDVGSAWNLNADLKYRFATESIKWLYAGGGLALAQRGRHRQHRRRAQPVRRRRVAQRQDSSIRRVPLYGPQRVHGADLGRAQPDASLVVNLLSRPPWG
jgi:hypothetical protein